MKKIVILGGGYAGVEAALTLHRRLKKREQVEVTLIDKNHYHTLLTELHEVAGNRVDEDAVTVSLRHILQYTRVRIVQDVITAFDLKAKKLHSNERSYEYDYLVLGLGSEPTFYGIEGMETHAFTLWSLEDALRIREHIREMVAEAARIKDPFRRQAYLTFVVGGGGFTGVEMVGELIRWRKQLAREYDIPLSEIKLVLVEAMDKILPNLSDPLIRRAQQYLEKHNVQVLTGTPISKAESDHIVLGKGMRLETRTLIWAGGVVANKVLTEAELPLVRRGRIKVNEYLQVEGYPEVFAAGDNCYLTWEEGDQAKEMPALVESALGTGHSAAENILADMRGTNQRPCRPKYHGLMVSIGRWFGVANIMGVRMSGVMAILMKHMVNLHYLFGIGGFELIIRYIKHEFLDMRVDNLNIGEIQFLRQRPLFFLLPLRLYLGYRWLVEGIKKVGEGWWSNQALGRVTLGFFGDPAIPVDGESGATLMDLITENTPSWYAWFVETVIYPNVILFQRMVIITEIGLGLAFIFGFMTIIAAVVSIGMNINFLLTTGLYDYWWIAASIPMLAGAGDVFGIDYFLMPYLMRQWRYFIRNKWINPFLFK